MLFKKRIFSQTENIFDDLAEIRKKRGISQETVSRKTKIPIKYIKALEGGSIKMLPDILYVKNIIKKYLALFNIDPRPFIAGLDMGRREKISPQKALNSQSLIVVPRLIKAGMAVLIVSLLLIYLIYGINKIFSPPFIAIISPLDKQTVSDSGLVVRGRAEKDAKIFINDEQVILDKDNGFSKEVNLQKGLNSIKISGVKRYGKERVIWLNVNLEI